MLSFLFTGATADGMVKCVTSASVIQAVYTAPATNPGNVFVTKVGVVCSVTKISTTAPTTNLVVMAALASTRVKDLILVLVLLDTMEQTARISYSAAAVPADLLAM